MFLTPQRLGQIRLLECIRGFLGFVIDLLQGLLRIGGLLLRRQQLAQLRLQHGLADRVQVLRQVF